MSDTTNNIKPGNLPELNGVSNAVMILEMALMKDKTDADLKADVAKALVEMRAFCKFSREFEQNPCFWHEFKAKFAELFEK